MRTPTILLVEDEEDYALLVRLALERQDPRPTLQWAGDGRTALRMMRESPPDLVLLDLNMPGMSGQDVLREMRGDPALRRIPVSILSSSVREQDVTECYDLHANAYLEKPNGFNLLVDMCQVVADHWFKTAVTPGVQSLGT